MPVRRLRLVLTLVVALAVPAVLLGNGLWLLINDWYVHAEYARPGFPDDRYGFTDAERTRLALVGLDSIHPFNGEGVQVLRDARLSDGRPAFNEREVQHMADVRALVGKVLLAHLLALSAIVIVWFAARTRGLRDVVSTGLLWGSGLTLALAATLGVMMLVDFEWFFLQFHLALFSGNTWVFASSDTLIRLYPDAFWSDFGGVLAGLTVLQAAVLGAALWWRRRSRARAFLRLQQPDVSVPPV